MKARRKRNSRPETAGADADPWPVALRLLTGRDHSVAGLRQKLARRGFVDEQIEPVLARCRELGYLDDLRFARARARSLLEQGRAIGQRLLLELRRQGLDQQVADQALQEVLQEVDEQALLQSLLDRRFPQFCYESAPASERRRVVQYLQRRGFPLDLIMTLLNAKGL
ncbi:MAG: regulatory protein RecX [Desulfuromonadales bacterium]|nr:regulatory protein RecX [Desulfuromonadales bacterium]